jgi:hypothetical protein
MECLCICSGGGGYLQINNQSPSFEDLARLTGSSVNQIEILMTELEVKGVFSRTAAGKIYCRRMVRAEKNRKNGASGGNPKILKTKQNQNSVNPTPNPLIPLPEPIDKKEESFLSRDARARDGHYPLPDNWEPNSDHFLLADQLGYFPDRVAAEAAAMRDWAKAEAKTKANWDAFFSKWLRDPRAKPNGGGSGYQRPKTLVEKSREWVSELERREHDANRSREGSDRPDRPIFKLVER